MVGSAPPVYADTGRNVHLLPVAVARYTDSMNNAQTVATANFSQFGEAFDEWLRFCVRAWDAICADPECLARFEALTKERNSAKVKQKSGVPFGLAGQ